MLLHELCHGYFTELCAALDIQQRLKLGWMFTEPQTSRSKIVLYVSVCDALPLLDNLLVAVLGDFSPCSAAPENLSGLQGWLGTCCYWSVLAQNRHVRSLGGLMTRSQA